ncbi:DUF192 domain-containing protein [Sinomicrobium weinanense]|uniref:DUF192 domain-containing protein n=1 Tax=Sinomicrobium weinanense TaxID=2842200 RepID=A0A926JSE6_9FLAO|nr:DUF192 domain-containing protein [Sinomicrobium weinanense]MBC9796531.1 DUF192 domain-containing protein [Sinomicrobium weinanense]MBU3123547.1 DUF192 domain-containing protein [Sinomicrobium weinanense]
MMYKIPVSLFLLLSLTLFVSCKSDKKHNTVKTEEIHFTKDGELKLFSSDSTLIKKLDIEIADDEYKRQTGLMYRSSMKENQGMLFIAETERPQNFYMKNTLIPLDIIYINSDKKIVSIKPNAEPMSEATIPSDLPAKYTLEVNAGLAEQWGLKTGDYMSFDRQ